MSRVLIYAFAILASGAMIAAAVLFIGRWQFTGDVNGAYRLDRWSGKVTTCHPSDLNQYYSSHPVEINCDRE